MKKVKSCNANWEPCHPGLIQDSAKDGISRRRLFLIAGLGTAVGIVGGASVLGMFFVDRKPQDEQMPGGLACITVHDHLIAFMSGKLEDPKLVCCMAQHLFKCDSCRTSYDEICCSGDDEFEPRPKKVITRPCPSSKHAP